MQCTTDWETSASYAGSNYDNNKYNSIQIDWLGMNLETAKWYSTVSCALCTNTRMVKNSNNIVLDASYLCNYL